MTRVTKQVGFDLSPILICFPHIPTYAQNYNFPGVSNKINIEIILNFGIHSKALLTQNLLQKLNSEKATISFTLDSVNRVTSVKSTKSTFSIKNLKVVLDITIELNNLPYSNRDKYYYMQVNVPYFDTTFVLKESNELLKRQLESVSPVVEEINITVGA